MEKQVVTKPDKKLHLIDSSLRTCREECYINIRIYISVDFLRWTKGRRILPSHNKDTESTFTHTFTDTNTNDKPCNNTRGIKMKT